MEHGEATDVSRVDRLRRFERALWRIRWFGVAFGAFQVLSYEPFPGSVVPATMHRIAWPAIGLLVAINVFVWTALRERRSERFLRRVGAIAFAADIAALWAIVWAFSFEQFGATWVILAIASLEGALRYRLAGALLPVALAVPVEALRELYRSEAFGFPVYLDSVTFRIGFVGIIAAVAGIMARDLDREREQAVLRAGELETLAQLEQLARAESNAFQEVIIAGVSAHDLREALERMLGHIAADLGYRHLAVLLLEEDRLQLLATEGFSPGRRPSSVGLAHGVAGRAARGGKTEIVADAADHEEHRPAEPTTRSQIAVPIRLGEQVIGVLDVESPEPGAFGEADATRLERLAAQMALVIENARLLSKERAMVDRLRELDQMRSDFIAIASHELRTPLTAIQGSVKTLQRPDLDISNEDLKTFLGVLDRQSDRLARLVEDLLMVSHIDAGGVSLRMERVSLGQVLEDLRHDIAGASTRLTVALPPSMPPILTDGHRLRQILRNLAENALKFSQKEAPVRVTAHHDGSQLLLEVADAGPGIAAEDIDRIFERFYQVGGSLRRRGEGFGLGLYIARRLVEAMGGQIDVLSRLGEGTTFRVLLPAVPAASDADEGIA